MKFCTVINCIDGRIQTPVIEYLRKHYDAEYVDSITESGPNLILSEQENKTVIQSIIHKVKISLEKHNSVGIAIVGHHDCAGNPSSKEKQLEHLRIAVQFLSSQVDASIIALWVDKNWQVNKITFD